MQKKNEMNPNYDVIQAISSVRQMSLPRLRKYSLMTSEKMLVRFKCLRIL